MTNTPKPQARLPEPLTSISVAGLQSWLKQVTTLLADHPGEVASREVAGLARELAKYRRWAERRERIQAFAIPACFVSYSAFFLVWFFASFAPTADSLFFPSWSIPLFWLVSLGVTTQFDERLCLHQLIQKSSDLLAQLEPLQMVPQGCVEALELVNANSACARLRDEVVARGEALHVFHLGAMKELVLQQEDSEREQKLAATCRELHLVPEAAA